MLSSFCLVVDKTVFDEHDVRVESLQIYKVIDI